MLINNYEFFENNADRKSPVFRFAAENASAQRNLYLTADDLSYQNVINAAQALVGYATVQTDSAGPGGTLRRWISRSLPASFPAVPTPDNPGANPYLWCTSVPVAEPVGRPNGIDLPDLALTSYDWYKLSTVWETLMHNLLEDGDVLPAVGPLAESLEDGGVARPDEGDALRRGWANSRFVVRQGDPGSRSITTRSIAQWAADEGQPAAGAIEGIAAIEPRATLRYTWIGVPYEGVNFPLINSSYGMLNDDVFDGFPSGTLLFLNPKFRQYRSAFGQRLVDYTFEMIYEPHLDEVTGVTRGFSSSLRVIAGKKRYWYLSANGTLPGPGAAAGVNLLPFTNFAAFFRPPQT